MEQMENNRNTLNFDYFCDFTFLTDRDYQNTTFVQMSA